VTVTVCVLVVVPAAFVAEYVIVVVPVGKKLPGGTPVRWTLTDPQSSLADALPSSLSPTIWPHEFVVTDTFGGTLSVGAVVALPITVMVCVHDAVPTLFVAVHSIDVTPLGKGSERASPSLRSLVTVTFGPVVVGVPISAAVAVYEHPLLAVNDLFDGQLIVGASEDVTVMS
jgi:hypothetical protein